MIKRTVTASWEPLTVDEAKAHCQIDADITDFNTQLTADIKAAREMCEEYLWRFIVTSTVTYRLSEFSTNIFLPRPPVSSITSITYKDSEGSTQTLATDQYDLIDWEEPARIVPAYGVTFPATRGQEGDVTITYVAGYASASVVPEMIKSAMKLMIYHLFENRSDVTNRTVNELPQGSKDILRPLRCFKF